MNFFKIKISALKQDTPYQYQYDLTQINFQKLFEDYTEATLKSISVEVELSKKINLLFIKFYVKGLLGTKCDRCANDIDINILDEFSLIIKTINNPAEANDNESDPDIFYIGFNDHEVDVTQWLRDFVLLSIPEAKHCNQDNKVKFCNEKIIKKFLS